MEDSVFDSVHSDSDDFAPVAPVSDSLSQLNSKQAPLSHLPAAIELC